MFVNISDYVIIKYDTEKKELQKYHYLESQLKEGEIITLEPVLSKTLFEILHGDNEEADLHEIFKKLVPDASEDETIKSLEKIC